MANPRRGLSGWIVRHDESTLFVVLYVGAAVILSITVGLFWLVVVVAVHALLELHRQLILLQSGAISTAARVLWEVWLDIGLVLVALSLAVYMELILGAAGLQASARVATRFVLWQRVIRGVLLSLDDAGMLAKMALSKKRSAKGDNTAAYDVTVWGGWSGRWSKGDRCIFWVTILFLVLLIASPALTDHSVEDVLSILASELRPLP